MPGKKKSFKKSLTTRSHPIPAKKIEKDKTKYDRKKSKQDLRRDITKANDDE